MKAYRYKKVDAFTSGNSLGNPAACLYLEKSQQLTDEQMLEVAKQHSGFVSEVVFCTEQTDTSFDLVYFSSECEVNFCGHGTIACMHSLISSSPKLIEYNEFTLNTRQKGSLTLYNKISENGSVLISAPAPLYLETKLTLEEITTGLELDMAQVEQNYPVDFIDAGNRTLIVPLKHFDECISLFPDEKKLKAFSLMHDIDVILIYCRDTKELTHKAHTRVFAPRFGYLEDPATGSANSAFGYYMIKNNMWHGDNITLEQGGNDRVFNVVNLCMENDHLLFGGGSTTRIEGVYYI